VIFPPEMARLIRRDKKTQTRRLVRNETRCRFKPGRTYAIQDGHGSPENGRIRILEVWQEPVGDISFENARAEGFRTRLDFERHWLRLHDRGWFEKHDDEEPADPEVEARFRDRHADRWVWVIRFEMDRDTPRLLHRDSSHGYTNNPAQALDDEPEAVDPRTQERFTKDAHARYNGGRIEELQRREERAIAARSRELLARARQQGVDVEDEVAKLREGLDGIRRRLEEAA
jgi:hypothetical protein